MKSTGIVRRIDSLGRIVLPIELRRIMDLDIKDPVEIFVDEEHIILKKYQPTCIFCNSGDDVITYKDKKICRVCLNELLEK
jgi:AbrB family transcriptional regulator, transcriptional pleiotropic regulator of transition state genes